MNKIKLLIIEDDKKAIENYNLAVSKIILNFQEIYYE